MRVTNFAELMSGETHATIRCLYTRQQVRTLNRTADGNAVEIVPGVGPSLVVPIDTPIRHEPWVMDRGNLVFTAPADGPYPNATLKICGAGDTITYANGETATADPAD